MSKDKLQLSNLSDSSVELRLKALEDFVSTFNPNHHHNEATKYAMVNAYITWRLNLQGDILAPSKKALLKQVVKQVRELVEEIDKINKEEE